MDQELVAYEAVLYCWGDPNPCVPAQVNGREYRLDPSPAGALQRFRKPSGDRWLWMDALCINQHDDEERIAQVVNICTIYNKAQRVLVWLGPAGLSAVRVTTRDDLASYTRELARDESPLSDDEKAVLEDLYTRPWATRLSLIKAALFLLMGGVRVQQEVFAAQAVHLSCGQALFFLRTYQNLAKRLRSDRSAAAPVTGTYRKFLDPEDVLDPTQHAPAAISLDAPRPATQAEASTYDATNTVLNLRMA
ncbi:hypothetical protein LTR53_006737 [Teratosphaeriaceae sp. CCFEE 6253]|nr:hypothetical protein LTR53_006737 [Teratosphaeriaceae sp. CCFEE 6253]